MINYSCHLFVLQVTAGGTYTSRRRPFEPSWRFWGLYVHVCKMRDTT